MALHNPQETVSPYVEGTANQGLVRVSFRVQSAGATTAPDFVIPDNAVSAATNASAGVYTVTLANYTKYAGLVSGTVCVLGATGTTVAIGGHLVSYTASTGVLAFDTVRPDTGALTDVANNDWICLDLCMALNAAEATAAAI